MRTRCARGGRPRDQLARDSRHIAAAGWAGKLWALHQGFGHVDRPFVLLLDADIELAPGTVPALRREALARNLSLVSIMAKLSCETFWERLLAPPFVFFFKLLYPFALANDPARRTAAAAGGCMFLRTAALNVDRRFCRGSRRAHRRLRARGEAQERRRAYWLGLSHSVASRRAYRTLEDFWRMVSRSAFTQLRYSTAAADRRRRLIMAVVFAAPLAGVASVYWAAAARRWSSERSRVAAMAAAYVPIVRFYGLPWVWALTLPVAAALFLAMTWTSAVNYWRGTRATWKNRSYETRN